MNKAWKSKHDYSIFQEKFDFVIPIPWIWRVEFDWNGFLDVSGVQWNSSFALKRTLCVFSVLKFLREKCKVFLRLQRSLLVLLIRVVFAYV